jgi:hypothetical protein
MVKPILKMVARMLKWELRRHHCHAVRRGDERADNGRGIGQNLGFSSLSFR